MIANNKHHISIFPTCVSRYDLNCKDFNELESLIIELGNEEFDFNGLIHQGWRSKDNYFLDRQYCVDLKSVIQTCIDDYCDYTGISSCDIKKSWLCKYEAFGNISTHRHELSLVSGVFYPLADELSGFLIFENPMQPFKVNETSTKETAFTQHRQFIQVEKGILILFPSWIFHRSDGNFSNKFSISFDCGVREK